jgi:hypothetical protein
VKTYGEWTRVSLTLVLDGGEWSASHPGHFIPRERAPRYPLDRGGWFGPRASVDDMEKRKFLTLLGLEL